MKTQDLLMAGLVGIAGAIIALPTTAMAQAAAVAQTQLSVSNEWAAAKYELSGKAQEKAFESLLGKLEGLRLSGELSKAQADLWEATTLSTYASVKGGTKALSMVKKAKALLEEDTEQTQHLEDGLAYGVLGSLYHRVPGWPLGFKDDKKAKKLLEAGVKTYPESVHTNFYYAEYLAAHKKPAQAKDYFEKVLSLSAKNDAQKQRQAEAELALKALG